MADTAMAVQEAKARGIRPFGIIIADEGTRSQMEMDYHGIFGGGWYVVVKSAEEIIDPLLSFMERVAFNRR